MASNFFKVDKGVTLAPQASVASPQDGDVYYDSARATYVFRNNGQNVDLQKRSDVASAASLTSSAFTASVVQSSLVRLTGSTAGDIHGLTASSDAKQLFLYNNSSQAQNIKHQSLTEATAANRIITSDGQDLTLSAGKSIQLGYDSNQSRWIVLSSPGSSASSGTGKNYIVNGDASAGTAGWTTYTSVLTVTAANVDTGGNTFTITGHGLPQGRRVQFTTSNTLPSPIAANTDYYVLNPTTNTFQVSTTVGGGAVDITTQGTGTHSVKPARPVVVAGSSTAVQIFNNTTSPLSGTSDFYIQRTSPSMGEGVYKAFTIDSSDLSRSLRISFDYKYVSGTYNNVNTVINTDSDMICLIQDVTNGTFIEPTSVWIDGVASGAPAAKYNATFQASANATSYRLLIHSAYDLRTSVLQYDNFSVSPQDYIYGTPITDWQDFPSVAANTLIQSTGGSVSYGSVATNKAMWRRVGGNMEIRWAYRQTSGGTQPAYLLFSIAQLGVQIDTSKAAGNTTVNSYRNADSYVGQLHVSAGPIAANQYVHIYGAKVYDSTRIEFFDSAGATSANGGTSSEGVGGSTVSIATACTMGLIASIPILGWGSSIQMSNETSTRVVDFSAWKNGGGITSNVTIASWTLEGDTHGTFNASTGVYTVPVPGDYLINASVALTSGTPVPYSSINGTKTIGGNSAGGRGLVTGLYKNCKVGDQITLLAEASGTSDSSVFGTRFSVTRVSGPSTIASTETVAASYYCSANQAMSTTQPINFDTKIYDTHNSVTTGSGWRFIAQTSGIYLIGGFFRTAGGGGTYSVYKNGTLDVPIANFTGTGPFPTGGYASVFLNAQEFLDIRFSASSTAGGGALSTFPTTITISRTGSRG